MKASAVVQAIRRGARARRPLRERADYDAGARPAGSSRAASPRSNQARQRAVIDEGVRTPSGAWCSAPPSTSGTSDSGDAVLCVTYQIVGDEGGHQARPSINSPIARALIGRHVGDVAEVRALAACAEYEIHRRPVRLIAGCRAWCRRGRDGARGRVPAQPRSARSRRRNSAATRAGRRRAEPSSRRGRPVDRHPVTRTTPSRSRGSSCSRREPGAARAARGSRPRHHVGAVERSTWRVYEGSGRRASKASERRQIPSVSNGQERGRPS